MLLFFLATLLPACLGLKQFSSVTDGVGKYPSEAYGYVDVRKGAHLFYWFYRSNNTHLAESNTPVVLWLQGGPGAGSTGYGNVGEIGPTDEWLNAREYAWTKHVHLLFIDQPVGAGFSYVDDLGLLTTDVDQIADDLLTCLKTLTASRLPFLADLPLWIFSESYGGKMTAYFGNEKLYPAIESGGINANFQGVLLGDSWIDAVAYTDTWADFVKAYSLVSDKQYFELQKVAAKIRKQIAGSQWLNATDTWGYMEELIMQYTENADFYNILLFDYLSADKDSKERRKPPQNSRLKERFLHGIGRYLEKKSVASGPPEYIQGVIATEMMDSSQVLSTMNGPMKAKMSDVIPRHVFWAAQSGAVFEAQETDFMKPVVASVDGLLGKGVRVAIWNGQVDLICSTLGTQLWMQKSKWPQMANFQNARKTAVKQVDASGQLDIGYFVQKYQNLEMYYVMKAGHMVPADNPVAAMDIMKRIVFG